MSYYKKFAECITESTQTVTLDKTQERVDNNSSIIIDVLNLSNIKKLEKITPSIDIPEENIEFGMCWGSCVECSAMCENDASGDDW